MDVRGGKLGRRKFAGMVGIAGAGLAAGCVGPGLGASGTATPATGSGPSPAARSWSWEIRYIRGTPRVEADWRLLIEGLVAKPLDLGLDELRALPRTEMRARMKCVECWSGLALWQGVAGSDLLALVKPSSVATHVRLEAVDGYDTTLPLKLVTAARSLFVYAMDGAPLPADNGFPLRLLIPSQYGYKNIKGIERLSLTDRARPGFWERAGYSDDGTIRAGTDHPLDLEGTRAISGGEITDY